MNDDAPLHFFTGENIYALEKELLRWKKAFCEKHGPENFLELTSKDATLSDLLDAVSVMPFIAEKRLVFLRGIPKIEREELKSVIEAVHPQVLFVITDPKPDKRLGATKEIIALAEKKEYGPLSIPALYAWARNLVQSEGAALERSAFDELIAIVGTDQWILESELKKIAAYAHGAIEVQHISEMAVPSGEQVVWRLTDLIGSKKADEALLFFRSQLERGEDPYSLWMILLNMIKNLTLVWSAVDAGMKDERSISSSFGMHFLSVRGLLPLARSLSSDDLHDLVRYASDADIALKSGGYRYSADRQGEIIALAERAIVKCR